MLGRTAGSLFWMFRYLERSENIARLIEAGFQIALTRTNEFEDVWRSVVITAGVEDEFLASGGEFNRDSVVDYLLRDRSHPYSVLSMMGLARENARTARTALTREVWEATNQCWLELLQEFKRPIKTRDLPAHLETVRRLSAYVRGALHGTMLRNDIYDFAHLGIFAERLESTARILDVKYYVLLPSVSHVGSSIDNVHWETILRSVSAHQSYRWLYQGEIDSKSIADFLILDKRLPRSISYCAGKSHDHLAHLGKAYGSSAKSMEMVRDLYETLENIDIESIFNRGLHEFLVDIIARSAAISSQIEIDYRFFE